MIIIQRDSVMNLNGAIRGMRNPMNSWASSDSYFDEGGTFVIGEKDAELCATLSNAGADHRKYMRMIFVCVDITAPLYWWKEYDTYKVGTVANSCSTMHKIHAKPFSLDDFSYERMNAEAIISLTQTVQVLERERLKYIETGDKTFWESIIQLLPTSYNQLRTCTLNYENLSNIYNARKGHKLTEWQDFCKWIERLPYFDKMIKRRNTGV